MKISGERAQGGLGYLYCTVTGTSPAFTSPIRFAVDTGAAATCLMDRDIARIGLKYSQMSRSPRQLVGVGGGGPRSFLIRGVTIEFANCDTPDHRETLESIIAVRHLRYRLPRKKAIIEQLPSLLGIDILQRYRISFDEDNVYLER